MFSSAVSAITAGQVSRCDPNSMSRSAAWRAFSIAASTSGRADGFHIISVLQVTRAMQLIARP